ncbi:MAG: LacI family DNA-binding transcriptional regulator [Polyangiaceae bacterium]
MNPPAKKARASSRPYNPERKSQEQPNQAPGTLTALAVPKRITIADLARLLGMDKSSISLALRDSPRVAESTRARVRAAAIEHSYSPNWAARQLAGSSGQAIGLVMPSTFECLVHPPVAHTTQALAQLAAPRGLTLNLIAAEQLTAGKEDSRHPIHADGLLVWGDVHAAAASQFAATYSRAAIVLDPHHPSYARYQGNAIRIQNRAGASHVAQHLADRGARHLTFVQVVAEHLGHIERWRGTRQTWLGHAAGSTIEKVALDDLTDNHLKRIADREGAAIFCSNDRGAMQIWHRLHKLNISVPGDVKLAGFDGDEYGSLVGLTTALFDSEALAEMAFESISALVSGSITEIGNVSVPVTLRSGITS